MLAGVSPITLVTGYFDVLRAGHVEALTAASGSGRTLVVAVCAHADAILPLRARAELVAALRMVDYVITADDRGIHTFVSSFKPAQIVRLEDADRARTRELKQHVQGRQSC